MKLRVTVNGMAYEVDVEILEEGGAAAGQAHAPAVHATPKPIRPAPAPPTNTPSSPAASGAKVLTGKIPGTVVEISVKPGDIVQQGQKVLVIDAMKMNTPIAASHAGTVKRVLVNVGDAVKTGQALVEFE